MSDKSTDSFAPFRDRKEHSFINKMSRDLVKIKLALKAIEANVDEYITHAKTTCREDD